MFARFVVSSLVGIPVGLTVFDYVGYIARVEGISMQPSLNPGSQNDYVFLSRIDIQKGMRQSIFISCVFNLNPFRYPEGGNREPHLAKEPKADDHQEGNCPGG